MDRHRRFAGHEKTLACARGRAELRRVCRADGSAAYTAESSGTCCATVSGRGMQRGWCCRQRSTTGSDGVRRSPCPSPIGSGSSCTTARSRSTLPKPAAPWAQLTGAQWPPRLGGASAAPTRRHRGAHITSLAWTAAERSDRSRAGNLVCMRGGWMNASQLARALRRVQARLEREWLEHDVLDRSNGRDVSWGWKPGSRSGNPVSPCALRRVGCAAICACGRTVWRTAESCGTRSGLVLTAASAGA